MRNPSQALLLAVLMASLILPPGLPVAGATTADPAARTATRRILLVGDSLSIGLGKQLETVFAASPGVRFAHLGKVSSGLANPAFFDWDAQLTAQVKAHHPDMVLIMVGANDDKPLPLADGKQAAFGTRDWDMAYAERLGRLHAIARAENPAATVWFIGVPVMGDPAFNAEMVHVNRVLAQAAKMLPGCSYIDVKDVLADPSGAFAPVAKAPDGGIVKLRAADGVHISGAGSRLLAARCLEAVSDAAGLPKDQLLASLEDKDLRPVASDATASVRLADARPAKAPARPVEPAAVVKAPRATPQVAAAIPAAAPVTAITAAKPAEGAYAVADGDTLWSVAKRQGVRPEALAAANPGVDPRRLSIGQALVLPASQAPTNQAEARPAASRAATSAQPAAGRVHAVAEGDNFWSVARRYEVTVAALTEANPGVEPTRLRIGQPLNIPGQAATVAAAPAVAANADGYVVSDGDNFWSIARRLGLDAAELQRANAAVDPLKLQPGQHLALPTNARAEAAQPAAPRHEAAPQTVGEAALYPVAKGDTLWALSRRFGVDFAALLSANGEIDPSRMQVGQLVTIPTSAPVASADSLVFPVSAGDTLWSIARRFDVSVDALAAANPGIDPQRLREGQTLRVPSSLAAVAASGASKPEPAKDAAPATSPADAAIPDPAPATIGEAARKHTVSLGDTLWSLSHRYGVSVDRILSENAGIDPVRLRIGQMLRLPGNSGMAMAAR